MNKHVDVPNEAIPSSYGDNQEIGILKQLDVTLITTTHTPTPTMEASVVLVRIGGTEAPWHQRWLSQSLCTPTRIAAYFTPIGGNEPSNEAAAQDWWAWTEFGAQVLRSGIYGDAWDQEFCFLGRSWAGELHRGSLYTMSGSGQIFPKTELFQLIDAVPMWCCRERFLLSDLWCRSATT